MTLYIYIYTRVCIYIYIHMYTCECPLGSIWPQPFSDIQNGGSLASCEFKKTVELVYQFLIPGPQPRMLKHLVQLVVLFFLPFVISTGLGH